MEYIEKYYEVTIFTDFHRAYDSLGTDKKYFKALKNFEFNKLYFTSDKEGNIFEIFTGLRFKKKVINDSVIYINNDIGIYLCEPLSEIPIRKFATEIGKLNYESIHTFFEKLEKISKKQKNKNYSLELK